MNENSAYDLSMKYEGRVELFCDNKPLTKGCFYLYHVITLFFH